MFWTPELVLLILMRVEAHEVIKDKLVRGAVPQYTNFFFSGEHPEEKNLINPNVIKIITEVDDGSLRIIS